MTDIEKAKQLFRDAGLAFPTIPPEFSARLKEKGEWIFATREIKLSPYNLQDYIREASETDVEDYVVLCHSGHGLNSYALQYYVVQSALRMFLHLAFGGVYTDTQKAEAEIHDCFSLADQIVSAAQSVGRFRAGERLTVVGSDFYGSYWLPPGESRRPEDANFKRPLVVLDEVLHWLTSSR